MCCFFDTKSMPEKNRDRGGTGCAVPPTAKKLARGREDASFQTFHDQKLD